ncbi:hypothetical protein RRG08_050348 [Elysia crispata]|uniref:Uncharacterized protein n=1 Tax=Elysia crispata TaxID=231223 RepID=A0AAE0XTJ8_9GAST|nr:hypothetical protein RRG08_050348 [Elysia crispata]
MAAAGSSSSLKAIHYNPPPKSPAGHSRIVCNREKKQVSRYVRTRCESLHIRKIGSPFSKRCRHPANPKNGRRAEFNLEYAPVARENMMCVIPNT